MLGCYSQFCPRLFSEENNSIFGQIKQAAAGTDAIIILLSKRYFGASRNAKHSTKSRVARGEGKYSRAAYYFKRHKFRRVNSKLISAYLAFL